MWKVDIQDECTLTYETEQQAIEMAEKAKEAYPGAIVQVYFLED